MACDTLTARRAGLAEWGPGLPDKRGSPSYLTKNAGPTGKCRACGRREDKSMGLFGVGPVFFGFADVGGVAALSGAFGLVEEFLGLFGQGFLQ